MRLASLILTVQNYLATHAINGNHYKFNGIMKELMNECKIDLVNNAKNI